MTTPQGPIACDLTKLPPGFAARLFADLRAVFASVQEVRPIENGYALRLPAPTQPGLLAKLGEIVDYDRLCCPFIRHAIVDEPWGGPVWFHLSGAAPVRAFLADELAALLPPEIVRDAGLRSGAV